MRQHHDSERMFQKFYPGVEEKETDFFYNCKAQGSIIDMMKFKSSVSENKNKSLIIDTNTEIPNYKKSLKDCIEIIKNEA